jgi:hypothetical protein
MWESLHEIYTWDWQQPKRMHHKIKGTREDAVRRARDRHADYYAVPSADVKVDYWCVIP